MNVLNRVIAIVLLVIIAALMAALIYIAAVMPEAAIQTVGNAVNSLQGNLTFLNKVIFFVVTGLILLAALLLLWLEVRRPQVRAIQVQDVSGGEARVTIDSIVQRLEYNISRLQDVTAVKPYVTGRGNGVEVLLSLQTTPEIDIPMKTEEVVQAAREVIETQMGLRLQKISVEIKHSPYTEDVM